MREAGFVFPGQGSQYVGMGKDLYEAHFIVRDTFEKANQILEEASSLQPLASSPLTELCFEGPEEELNQTVNTQIAVFTFDCALYFLLRRKGINPKIVAGHSLGEYAALVAAEVIDFEEGFKLVKKRAELMQESAAKNPGKMLAILGLEIPEVKAKVQALRKKGIAGIANYNCSGQVVISVEDSLKDKARETFEETKAKVVVLKVSGAFHSSLMSGAQEEFFKILKMVKFKEAKVPVVSNYTAKISTEPKILKEALANQITGSVLWEQSVREMARAGIKIFVEMGPGKVLSGLIRRTLPQAQTFTPENLTLLEGFLKSEEEL